MMVFDQVTQEFLDKHGIKSERFCSFPFFQIAIKEWADNQPDLIAPCCNAIGVGSNPMKLDMESIRKNFSMNNVFHSEQFDKLRKDLLAGVPNDACTYCWKLEEHGSYSPRALSVEYHRDAMGDDGFAESINEPKLTAIDTNFDNTCNLRCRMCSPNNSVLLQEDLDNLIKQDLYVPENILGYKRGRAQRAPDPKEKMVEYNRKIFSVDFSANMTTQTFDELKTISHQIRGMRIAGGEPTVSKYFWEWMDHLDQHGLKKNITMHLTTNGTKFNKKFFQAIRDFRKVELIVSIDGVGKPYEYLRHPFPWDKIQHNIEALDALALPNVVINIVYIINALTLSSVPELIRWASTLKYVQLDANVFLRPNDSPLSARWLPQHLLAKYIREIVETLEGQPYNIRDKTLHAVDTLRYFLTQPYDAEKQKQLLRDLIVLDRVRHQTYRDYLDPELIAHLDAIEINEEYLSFSSLVTR